MCGTRPFFVTRSRGQGEHTDVSLWYLVPARSDAITWHDSGEFGAIRWLALDQVLAEPIRTLDPHMHRFTRKLQHDFRCARSEVDADPQT